MRKRTFELDLSDHKPFYDNHDYQKSIETIHEEEHNYFTASFQNLCC